LQIRVTGRHVQVADNVRSYAEEKLGKLLKFFDRISSIEMILESTRDTQHAEAVVHVEHNAPLVADAKEPDIIVAIDQVVEKLERQLKKHKESLRDVRKHSTDTVRGSG